MADLHIVGNIGFFTDDAFIANLGIAANVDIVPDRCSRSKSNTWFDNRSGMDHHRLETSYSANRCTTLVQLSSRSDRYAASTTSTDASAS